MSSTRRAFLRAAAALLLPVIAGCAGPRINMWPLYYQERRAAADGPVTDVEFLYPVFGLHKVADSYWYVVRPLYNYESGPEQDSHRLQYLWPLGLQKKDGDRLWFHRFWPLFVHSNSVRPGGGGQMHGVLFPLLFWGYRPPEGPYFAVFPLAGVTHGLLGDTFSFVAFPLYSYYRQGNYSRHNFLWPFFTVGGTPDGKRKVLRIWPLYIHHWRENTWDHHYLLWPFVRWGTQKWASGKERFTRSYFVVNPFYATEKTCDAQGNVVAGRVNIFGGGRSWDDREGSESKGWTFLMSLVRNSTSPGEDEFGVIPFYWVTRRRPGGPDSGRQWVRRRILWPIVWVDSIQENDRNGTSFILAPIYWHHETHYTAGEHAGKTDRRVTLWPAATWEASRDGTWHLSVLSAGWHDASEGFKRNYRAFLDVFQVGRDAEGEKEVRLLWRLYHQRWGPAGRYLSLGPLVTYDGVGDAGAGGRKSFSCLFGLVKHSWSEKDSGWRILYLPPGK